MMHNHQQEDKQQHNPNGHSTHHADHTGHELMFRNRFWVSLILTIPVLLYSEMVQDWFGFSMPEFTGSTYIAPLFSIIIFLYGGVPFIQMTVPEIRNRQPGMMSLISLAISVAFLYSLAVLFADNESGFFWEMATLIDVMLLGHWFEMRSVRQASGALNELAKLMPDEAELIQIDGTTKQVPVSNLQKDDVVLVRPGASIPIDGQVIEGQSKVDEAIITGESKPVSKTVESRVIGGTINGDGSLHIQVTAIGDETTLAGIMRLVNDAQNSKSKTQMLADRAAGWLFYIAVASAVLTGIAWIIAIGFDVQIITRVVTVLVVACPHALGLAIPLVIAISTSLAARNGILVRDRIALETARNLNVIVFDKTGTLTAGKQGVVAIAVTNDWTEEKALALAGAVEGDSEHMIARGVVDAARQRGIDLAEITDFAAIKGRGVEAKYQGQAVHVGGPRLLELLTQTLPTDIQKFTNDVGAKGQTVVYLIYAEAVVSAFALADVIRPESRQAVERLHAMNIEVAMLTGDSEAVAKSVAEELGIDHYFAEVLPEHKDQKIMELQQQGKIIGMVGDGVNDAPALTRADIGIAIGSGTDAAIESAGIVLVQSNPLDVVNIIQLSKASFAKMRQNLVWATIYNIAAIPLAAGILAPIGFLLPPAIGALFMSLSTVIVSINAMSLRRLNLSV